MINLPALREASALNNSNGSTSPGEEYFEAAAMEPISTASAAHLAQKCVRQTFA
jgi:hypothetical protein